MSKYKGGVKTFIIAINTPHFSLDIWTLLKRNILLKEVISIAKTYRNYIKEKTHK